MSKLPFQCDKCKNWFTPVPVKEEEFCWPCDSGTHAPHHKSGVIDCHFGQESATQAEVQMSGIVAQIRDARDAIREAAKSDNPSGMLAHAETRLSEAEIAQERVSGVMQWAGVMELPGMAGEDASKRFKNIEAVAELVRNSRRPPSDLATLRRSVRNCEQLSAEIPKLMADARVAIGQLRQAVMHPKEKVDDRTEEEKQAARERMARVRAGQSPKAVTV